jgi:hypothetical protein
MSGIIRSTDQCERRLDYRDHPRQRDLHCRSQYHLGRQDWGGTLGLTLPVDAGLRSKLDWLFVMNTIPPVRRVTPQLSDEEMTAYDAPFLDSRFNAGRSHVS